MCLISETVLDSLCKMIESVERATSQQEDAMERIVSAESSDVEGMRGPEMMRSRYL